MIARISTRLALIICAVLCAPASGQTTWYVDGGRDAENGCTSWEDACPELQAALSLATGGDEIWVAAGAYRPDFDVETGQHTGDRSASFQLISGVGVYGGFAGFETSLQERAGHPELTILTGDLNGDDLPVECEQDSPDCDSFGGRCTAGECIISDNNSENSTHVTIGSGTDNTAILDGFTITAGHGDNGDQGGGMFTNGGSLTVTNCTFSGNAAVVAGGMYIVNNSNPTLTDCTFRGNFASTGGGMHIASSSPTLIGCTFARNSGSAGGGGVGIASASPQLIGCSFIGNSANSGGGISAGNSSSPTVTNCTFSGNRAAHSGGAMLSQDGSLTVTSCLFIGNSATVRAGGMDSSSLTEATVTNSVFVGNTGGTGGGMRNGGSNLSLTNCTFSGNFATVRGGGISNTLSSSPTLVNCTFSGNSSGSGGGISNILSSSPTVSNCILWGNEDTGGMDESAQINDDGTSATAVTFTLIQGLDSYGAAVGNIDADPLFVDPAGVDDIPGTADDNVRLSPGSPAIDSANNNAVPPDTGDLDDDGDTAEPIPIDLDGEARFIDDPATADCPQPNADCGIAPIADMGAYEFGADCNDNGIPDDIDIANETSDDCNANGIPDECELPESCPEGICTAGCDADCNANCVIDSCDMDSADPDGNGEVSDDCNGNGIPDDCDLDPLDPDGDGEISIDCNGNDVPDECEIADCPPNTPFCDDCNLNGVLDGCDIDPADPDGNGEVSEDVDPTDGVPDECVHLIEGDVNWTDDIWDLDAQYPDNDEGNPDGVPDLHVTLTGVDTVVFLDETVATDTLRIQDGATLQVTQTTVGDLTLEDPGGLLVEGILLAANRRIIDVTAGVATIGLDGIYQADPAAGGLVSAVLQSSDIVVQGGTSDEFGGVIELTGSMELISLGDLSLESNETDKGGGDCKGSGTPPDFNSMGNSRVEVSGDFSVGRCSAVSITSTEHLLLNGDMQNQSTTPLDFDWETGGLLMNGPGHLIEAAGEDRGPWPIGLEDNFAIGTLTLAPAAIVQVVDEFDNQQDGVIACDEALYVDTLVIGSGAVLLTDGCRVYYNELTNDGAVPGLGIDVLEIREPIAPDLNGDGEVDAFDLASLLGSWGPCPPEDDCPADVDGDGDVDAFDLASLLGVWGPVP